jgi:4-azaleucine resistance transporter AzlC
MVAGNARSEFPANPGSLAGDKGKMKTKRKALKAAFSMTIPVMTGYLVLGAGFGILMSSKGLAIGWSVLMSAAVFAGSLQYVSVSILTAAFNPLYALILALMINARHLFYGLSMLEKYAGTGRLKPYLVFGLTDETFSLLVSGTKKDDVDSRWFSFFVTLLGHVYWILGSTIGAFAGAVVRFDTKGLDFVLTALFVVIFLDQWRYGKHHIAAIIGIAATILGLFVFGQTNFMIPSLLLILGLITIFRKTIDKGEGEPQ